MSRRAAAQASVRFMAPPLPLCHPQGYEEHPSEDVWHDEHAPTRHPLGKRGLGRHEMTADVSRLQDLEEQLGQHPFAGNRPEQQKLQTARVERNDEPANRAVDGASDELV